MDARNYQSIVQEGYRFRDDARSTVAFFPFYPKLCQLLSDLTACRADVCLLLVSNLFLFLTLTSFYFLADHSDSNSKHLVLAVFCLFPTTFFLRMGYAESLFCFFMVMVLLGMNRRWPVWVLALLAGLASGTRPVGIAVSATVWWYVVVSSQRRSQDFALLGQVESGARELTNGKIPNSRWKKTTLLWIIPLSCSGLLLYMAYLGWTFGAPLAFAQTQEHWTFQAPKGYTFTDKAVALLTLEPIWNVYNPDSTRYWLKGRESLETPLFNMIFWNPVFYVLAWLLIAFGWWKHWLKDYEIVLSIGLLLIPYITRSYEMSMASHARFSAIIIPQYFVLGRIVAMLPPVIICGLCGLFGLIMGLWTALFVAGYPFF